MQLVPLSQFGRLEAATARPGFGERSLKVGGRCLFVAVAVVAVVAVEAEAEEQQEEEELGVRAGVGEGVVVVVVVVVVLVVVGARQTVPDVQKKQLSCYRQGEYPFLGGL